MSNMIVSNFFGEEKFRHQKGTENSLLVECATNAQLHDGALRPIPCPELLSVGNAPYLTYTEKCGYQGHYNKTKIHSFGPEHLMIDREGYRPHHISCFCDSSDWKEIGLPKPIYPLRAKSQSGSQCHKAETSVYYYTYVRYLCGGRDVEESPLSPPSNVVCGAVASISGPPNHASHYGIMAARIYKSIGSWRSGEDALSENQAGLVLVGETPIGKKMSLTNDLSDLGMIAPITEGHMSMPVLAKGVGVSDFSVYTWRGSELWFSADGFIHTAKPSGRYKFDDDIITANYWRGNTYVFTYNKIYIIEESASPEGVSRSNPPSVINYTSPPIDKWAVKTGNDGLYYLSNSGLMVVSGAEVINLGSALFPTSTWKTLDLSRADIHVHDQYLFMFSPDWGVTYLFETEDGTHVDVPYSNMVRYPYRITSMVEKDGEAYFISEGGMYRFVEESCEVSLDCDKRLSVCNECCEYDYRFRALHELSVGDWSSIYLRIGSGTGDVTFRLWDMSCGKKLMHEKTFSGCGLHECKLPHCRGIGENYMVQLTGCGTVHQLKLGTSGKDMSMRG